MTIHRRLLVTYFLVTALAVTLLGVYTLSSFEAFFRGTAEADLMARAHILAPAVGEALARGERRLASQLMHASATEGVRVRVIDPQGRLLLSTTLPEDRRITDWQHVPGIPEALAWRTTSGIARGVLAREDRLYVAVPVVHSGQLLGALRTSITLQHFRRRRLLHIQAIILAVVAALGLCTLVSLWLARSLAVPIQAMRDFAVHIAAGEFTAELAVRRSDELGELAAELRRMGQQLSTAEADRRAFLANVAHELRTPVTNVQVTVDALSGGAAEDDALRERFLHAAHKELDRLRRLVEDLLELGRLEAGAVTLASDPVSLPALVRHTVQALGPRFHAKSMRVTTDLPDLILAGDDPRLTQVLMIVLDNAVKHAPSGSTVFITGDREGGMARLRIRDEGLGVPPEDLDRIFEQFYTGDPSRAGRGLGLGLSIARRIVRAHGGSITAASAPGEGTTFTLLLPLHPLQG